MVIVLSLLPLKNLSFNSNYDMWFVEGDPAISDFNQFKKDYDWTPQLLIGFEQKNKTQDDEKIIVSLIDWLQKRSFTSSVVKLPEKSIISVKVVYPDMAKFTEYNQKFVKEVQEQLEQYKESGLKFYLGGIANNSSFFKNSMRDRNTLTPLFVGLVLLLLVWFFKTAAGVLIPLLVIILTAVMSYSVLGWMSWQLNILNSILILIVLSVSISDCVHFLTEFYRNRRNNVSCCEAIELTFKSLFRPCFYTTLTTSAGFVSLAFSNLQPVREFGIAAAFGVWFAFFFTFFLVPLLLKFAKSVPPAKEAIAVSFLNICSRYKYLFISMSVILICSAVTQVKKIESDSSYKEYFKKDSKARADIDWFSNKAGLSHQVEVIIDLPKKSIEEREKALLKAVRAKFLEIPYIETVVSANNLSLDIIRSQKLIAADQSSTRIKVLLSCSKSRELQQAINSIEKVLEQHCPKQFKVTGRSVLEANIHSFVNQGVKKSFCIAAIIIAICLVLSLRSIKYSSLAMLLSLWPLLLTAGLMPLFNISLNLTTMLIAAITLSTVVDDNIHIMTKFMKSRKQGLNINEALSNTMKSSGVAVLISSVILGLGFSINILGSHNPTHQFGILATSTVILALLADTVIFSSLVYLNKRRNKDY